MTVDTCSVASVRAPIEVMMSCDGLPAYNPNTIQYRVTPPVPRGGGGGSRAWGLSE